MELLFLPIPAEPLPDDGLGEVAEGAFLREPAAVSLRLPSDQQNSNSKWRSKRVSGPQGQGGQGTGGPEGEKLDYCTIGDQALKGKGESA